LSNPTSSMAALMCSGTLLESIDKKLTDAR
jgi:hypothetical protein